MNWNTIGNGILLFLRGFWALLLTPIVLLGGASVSVTRLAGEEAIRATRRDYVYDNDRLLLGAYNSWLQGDPGVLPPLAKEAGLDFVVSRVTDTFLDQCQAAGIGVIAGNYNLPTSYYTIPESSEAAWKGLSMASYKGHPALWGDDLIDEPTSAEFAKINGMLASYYPLETGRLPYINLFPIYANEEQLGNSPDLGWKQYLLAGTTYSDEQLDKYRRHTADYIRAIDTDYISVDIYPYKTYGTNDNWLHNLDILAEACRDTGRDLWVITQAAGNAVNKTDGESQRWCDQKSDQLQQDYASLAFGAKAIIYACLQTGWWDADSHMLTYAGERTDTFRAVQAANAELAPFAREYGKYDWRGAYLVNAARTAGSRYELANCPAKKDRLRISTPDGLLVGCFDAKEGGGKAYVIANMMELLDQKTASLCVTFPKGAAVTVYGGGETKSYPDGGRVEITLEPGDGRFVTVDN